MLPNFCGGQDITINGITLNTVDDLGCRWIVTDLEGWWGLPEGEVPDDSRGYLEDGGYYTAGRYAARKIVLKGSIDPYASTGTHNIVVARDRLSQALMPLVRSEGVLRVDEPDAAKRALVQLEGRPVVTFDNLTNVLTFDVPLRANDVRKYSLDEVVVATGPRGENNGRTYPKVFPYNYGGSTSSGSVTVNNEGNYVTSGIIRIQGPITSPRIEHVQTGAVFTVNITLSASDYIDIDLEDRTVILNGVAQRRRLVAPNSVWFGFTPGLNTLRFAGTIPVGTTPTMTVTYRSAWIE